MAKQPDSLESFLSHFDINFDAEKRVDSWYRAPILWLKLTGFCAAFYGIINRLDIGEKYDNCLLAAGITLYAASSLASFYLSRRRRNQKDNHKTG